MTLLPILHAPLCRRPAITGRVLTFVLAGLLASAGAMAEKPDGGGGGKHAQKEKHEKKEKHAKKYKHDSDEQEARVGGYFHEEQRVVVRTYYTEQYRMGRCPPGLAKKHNGCMPPGQARRWVVGQPLPREVVYYSVPAPVIVQLGAPPAGHRYVRIATDILLIAIGTGLVVDAINDLGQM